MLPATLAPTLSGPARANFSEPQLRTKTARHRRVAHNYNGDKKRLGRFHLVFYALNKGGLDGGTSLWATTRAGQRMTYAVHDGTAARLGDCAPVLEGSGG